MAGHPVREEMEAMVKRALAPDAMLSLSRHLAACPLCRAKMSSLAFPAHQTVASVDWYAAGELAVHLSEDEIATAAADFSKLDVEAASHLKNCDQCSREIYELRRPSPQSIATRPRTARPSVRTQRWPLWAGLAAAAIIIAVIAPQYSSPEYRARLSKKISPDLVASLNDDGGIIGVQADGNLRTSKKLPSGYAALVLQALTTHRLSIRSNIVTSGDESSRSQAVADPAFRLLHPLAETTIATPQFRWQPLSKAEHYEVEVWNESFLLVLKSPLVRETSWIPSVALAPGHRYTWVVRAKTASGKVMAPQPPQPEARFEVADSETLSTVAAAASQYPDFHLLLASIYANAGMRSLAAAELRELQQQNPGSSLVEDLTSSVEPAIESMR